jgi:hypothetical protein
MIRFEYGVVANAGYGHPRWSDVTPATKAEALEAGTAGRVRIIGSSRRPAWRLLNRDINITRSAKSTHDLAGNTIRAGDYVMYASSTTVALEVGIVTSITARGVRIDALGSYDDNVVRRSEEIAFFPLDQVDEGE